MPGIIAVNVIVFLLQGSPAGVEIQQQGILFGPSVADSEFWRIVTSAFLHGSIIHIGFNMYLLWILGNQLEQSLGKLRFSLIYLTSLFGGSTAVLWFDWGQATIGASGAVLGVGGAMAALLTSRGQRLFDSGLGFLLLMNLALPLIISNVSFWGHAGGIVAGYAAGWLVTSGPARFDRQSDMPSLAVAGLAFAMAVLAVVGGLSGGVLG